MLHEEHLGGRAKLEYCKTDVMLADALTKLAGAPVIETLHKHMDGGSSFEDSKVSGAVAEELDDSSRDSSVVRKVKKEKRMLGPSYFVMLLRFHFIPCSH